MAERERVKRNEWREGGSKRRERARGSNEGSMEGRREVRSCDNHIASPRLRDQHRIVQVASEQQRSDRCEAAKPHPQVVHMRPHAQHHCFTRPGETQTGLTFEVGKGQIAHGNATFTGEIHVIHLSPHDAHNFVVISTQNGPLQGGGGGRVIVVGDGGNTHVHLIVEMIAATAQGDFGMNRVRRKTSA